MVTERRRERRLKAELPIAITYSDNPPIYTHTENISRLGVYVEIEQEFPLGTKLDITIGTSVYANDLSLAEKVRCRGDVFRCNLARQIESKRFYGLGIFFTDFFDGEDRNKLSKCIDFLILKEQEDIKRGMQRWRNRGRKPRD